jgi:LacI family transcriptional regulator
MVQTGISLNDIAKKLQLSPMTVSRVVNRSGSVSAETQARVLAALQELGYRKDRFASINSRKRGQQPRIRHVIVDRVAERANGPSGFTFYDTIALAVMEALTALGCQATATDLTYDRDRRLDAISSADAIIFCSPVAPEIEAFARSLNRELHCVTICHQIEDAASVTPDDEGGGRLAADCLLRAGHRHIAIFGSEDQPSYAARADSCARQLRRGQPGIRIDRLDYRIGVDGVTSSDTAMEQVLADYFTRLGGGQWPTACFAVGGYATFILYRYLRRQGLAIPQQMGVLGFDSLPFYDQLDVPLSRIGFPVATLGTQAVDVLLRAASATHSPAAEAQSALRIAVTCEFIERGSVLPLGEMRDVTVPRS